MIDVTANMPEPPNAFPVPWMPVKTIVRILMVTDDDGSYTKQYEFGLTELVDALESLPSVFVTFKVTKAHRHAAAAATDEPALADIQVFRFDNPDHFNPSNYDQIWLIGNGRVDESPSLTQAELRIVSQFMDQGGGVFATGDHEDLGRPLCGEIPRVRSMRKWAWYNGTNYEAHDPNSNEGPPVYGSHRHDTLVAGHNSAYTFDDQSDDIPARIYPKMYGPQNKYFSTRYPHPLLCSSSGIIDILPDHMHEGECVVPTDLSQLYTFDGYTAVEFPSGSGGQVIPDVIALGEVIAHVTDKTGIGGRPDILATPRQFGIIGAYDGHAASVGRVVVDSSFHHFVNINVIASGANSSDPMQPEKQVGFAYSAAGRQAYDKIRAYWRNIAIWISRPHQQMSMFYRTLWMARWDSQLRNVIPAPGRRTDISWGELLQYGGSTRATLQRLASVCTSYSWYFAWDNPLARYHWWLVLTLPDPPPWEIGEVLINPEEYMIGSFGAIMRELVHATPTRDVRFRDNLDETMPGIIRAGLAAAARTAMPHYERRMEETAKMLAAIGAAGNTR